MGKDRLRRLLTARYARGVCVTLLAATSVGQAIAQAVTLGGGTVLGGGRVFGAGAVLDPTTGFSATLATEDALPLTLLALLATVPLAVYRPVMAAVAVTFGNVVALASFGQVTAAGAIAELAAACWLGLEGGPARAGPDSAGLRSAALFRRPSGSGRAGPGAMAGRYLAVGLALPFLGIALAEDGRAAVLLASAVPVAAGAGIAVWAGRLARTRTEAGEILADAMLAHMARGERARIARELHDVVAHHISMIAVLAETGRLATPGLPEAGARRFLEIGDTARAGLTEMRRLLGVLREDAADTGPGPGGDGDGRGASGVGGGGRPGAGGHLVPRLTSQAATGARVVGAMTAGRGPTIAGGGASAAGADGPAAGGGARASRQPQPGLAQLTELIDAAREASVAGTRLIISGRVAPLDPGVELAAYRIVQEALTNARRHAPGAAVDVELRYGSDALRVRVRDNGPGPVTAPDVGGLAAGEFAAGGLTGRGPTADGLTAGGGYPADTEDGSRSGAMQAGSRPWDEQPNGRQPGGTPTGGGHGLLGMRERAFSVGGALYVGAAPGGGFLVEAVLPSEPDPVRSARADPATSSAGPQA
jgi:signal transduction histidine kinase